MEPFTKREQEIVDLLADGKLRKEIADALKISKNTVNSHIKTIHHKAGVNNTAGLLKKVREQKND